MKMSISAKSVAGLGLFIAAAFLLEAGAEHQFEAIRLRTGRFEYRMMKADKEIAKFNQTVEKAAGDTFRLAGEAVGYRQKCESIEKHMYAPEPASVLILITDGNIYTMTYE